MTGNAVYLDYNATAPLHPAAREAVLLCLERPANASSIHAYGREARTILQCSRGMIAESLGVDPSAVMFTASGTESNNHILHGVEATEYMVSVIEHASVLQPLAERKGTPVTYLPVTKDGVVDLAAFQHEMEHKETEKPLVSVMLANNETGVIQPIAEIADIAHHYGAVLHCDAAQAYGKVPFTLAELGADLLTISAHKCGGPVGAAALVTNGCMSLKPYLYGGGQESNRRAGTENIAAIAGWSAVVDQFDAFYSHMQQVGEWRDTMETILQKYVHECRIFGAHSTRLPTTSCLNMPGVENATQLMHFDLAGIAVSSGSACTSGKVERSHVLEAMQVAPEIADAAIRVSAGWNSCEADFKALIDAWKALYDRVGTASSKVA